MDLSKGMEKEFCVYLNFDNYHYKQKTKQKQKQKQKKMITIKFGIG